MVNHLSAWDYAVFGGMLLFSGLIGVYYNLSGGKQQTAKEFLLADKSMSAFPVGVSIMASFMSAISLLGITQEMYMYGTQFVFINISYALCTPIAAYIFLPVFYDLRVTSVYEYLERRFNKTIRIIASLVFMISMIVYMSIVLYAPALALSAVSGISKWYAIIILGAVCTLYCTIGGIKAVLWTDVFQATLMVAAMLAIIIKGSIDVGGLGVVWERAKSGGRIQFDNISPNPTERHTLWSLAFGGTFMYASINAINQIQIQRLLTVRTLRSSQIALFLSWPMTSVLSITTCLAGLVIYATYYNCDPLFNNDIQKSDQLLPYFVIDKLTAYPGLSGLIISGLFSGSLSSVSSFVNSCSAVTLEDYIKPYYLNRKNLSEKTQSIAVKVLALFFGFLCIALTYLVERVDGLLQAALTIFGVTGGPLLALFTAGMCFKRCNSIGALIGFVISLAFGCWVGFGSIFLGQSNTVPLHRTTEGCVHSQNVTEIDYSFNITRNTENHTHLKTGNLYVYNISYMWLTFMAWFIGLLVSLIVSHFVGPKPLVDSSLLAPICRSKTFYDFDATLPSKSIVNVIYLNK